MMSDLVARALVPVSMGPGGGPTKMYENPRVSRPLPLIWGWVFDAAAPALMPALGALPLPSAIATPREVSRCES